MPVADLVEVAQARPSGSSASTHHRAELEDPEVLPVAPDADLAEEDRAAGVEPDRERERREDRRDRDQAERGGGEVEAALEQPRRAREPEAAHAQHRHAVDVVELDGGADRPRACAAARSPARRPPSRCGSAPRRRSGPCVVGAMMIRCDARRARPSGARSSAPPRLSTRCPLSGSVATTCARARLLSELLADALAPASISPITRQRSTGDSLPRQPSARSRARRRSIAKLSTHRPAISIVPQVAVEQRPARGSSRPARRAP